MTPTPTRTTIKVICDDCGKKMRVPESRAGKKIRCKECDAPVRVPHLDQNDDDGGRDEFALEPAEARPSRKRRRPRDDDDDDDQGERRRPRRKGPIAPKKRKSPIRRDYDEAADREGRRGEAFGAEKSVLSGGMIGGGLAMIGAVVWFIAGLAAGYIFFYPPILFVIGLVGFIKGLAGAVSTPSPRARRRY